MTDPSLRAKARPRRSPDRAERRRDAERARERILAAAEGEFGDAGYAGARVRSIAARAGLNQQLISYYFGGKAGLYQALQQRWQAISAPLNPPDAPLDEVVANFVRTSLTHRSGARLLAWQGLTGDTPDSPEQAETMRRMVDDLRRRQAAGELAPGLDPAHVALALFAAAAAPALLPHVARLLTGADPDTEEFVSEYGAQLARLVRRLRPPSG